MDKADKLISLIKEPEVAPQDALKYMFELIEIQIEVNIDKALNTAIEALKLSEEIQEKKSILQANYLLGIIKGKQRLFSEAIQYFETALPISIAIKSKENSGNILQKLGTIFLQAGNHKKAIENYNEARIIKFDLEDHVAIAEIDTNMGAIYQFTGSYSLALRNYFSAIKIFEKDKEETKIASIQNNIGIIFLEQKNYDEAMKHFLVALKIREKKGERAAEAAVLNNIGNIFKEKKENTKALEFHQKALDIKTSLNEIVGISNSLNNIGNLHLAELQFEKAIEFFKQSLKLRESIKDDKGMVESYINLGEVYFELKLIEKSKGLLFEALKIAQEKGFKYQLQDIYLFLSKIFSSEQIYDKAYEYIDKYMNVHQEITNLQTSHQMAQMTSRYEIEQKEREAEIERMKNKELQEAYQFLEIEKTRSEELLHNILPIEVANELKETGKSKAKHYNKATVLFADIKGFTTLSEQLDPQQLIDTIDVCFKKFDDIIELYGVEKIKVIGDCYMCAGGLPIENETNPMDVVNVGLAFLEALKDLNKQLNLQKIPSINFRIGIHTGPLVSGIVGRKKFTYDIWGDTVNVAARMEQSGEAGRVNISGETYALIKDFYKCSFRGKIEAKNKGKIDMYFVEGIL